MASPVRVAVENPHADSDTVSGVIPRALNARGDASPMPLLALAEEEDVGGHGSAERSGEHRAVDMPGLEAPPESSAVTVTLAGLNSMRSIA